MQYEIGRVSLLGNRKNNQDRLGVAESHAGVVLILGDGLGGKPGGELASETLVRSVQHQLRHEIMPVDNPEKLLEKLIINAHYAVRAMGQKQTPPIEPGSTAVLCLVQNKKAWWAHVGDSRFYLFRDGLPIYRTQDDSFVEHLYQKGEISIEKRAGHPMRNYVTQCIGLMENEPKVTVSKGVDLQVGDALLLCSDGFWEPLDDAQIGANLAENRIKDAITKLAARAEQSSYPKSDNTTVVAMKITSMQDTANIKTENKSTSKKPESELDGAIQEIQDAFNYYKDEMDE
ncbi:MAG: protein phosphatase 2C domain-containing protein [Gammaproteobacteria bacterium]|nr:protein phosphatase 2C domain-containing protein [Gammaproteobacteria bacterium]MCW8987377.1 protein phosphatase 2C domain-containing protein [Gammaproteobacteria bacterium]MCW9031825.1 protein phosphatase 2C domain-containing protein [Gammaproteobacteria bacterium]